MYEIASWVWQFLLGMQWDDIHAEKNEVKRIQAKISSICIEGVSHI